MDDTIAAVATPPGNGGIAVIRISGGKAEQILQSVFSYKGPYRHAQMVYGTVADAGEALDTGYAVLFRAPKSFTGEDVAELHVHGGQVGVARVLACAVKYGARPARPGEFSRRAFLNGKMDLTEAEAVCDYIGAVSAAGAKASSRQVRGALHDMLADCQDVLTDLIAEIEAAVEYPEEDLEPEIAGNALPVIEKLKATLQNLEQSYAQGKIIKDGLLVSIVGKPNVGKSSLLNALAGRDRAIVSDVPGTTRDTIDHMIAHNGIAIYLTDTAGIRNSEDVIETDGILRANNAINDANLVIFVLDATREITGEDKDVLRRIKNSGAEAMAVLNKIDAPERLLETADAQSFFGRKTLAVSAKTGENIDELKGLLFQYAVVENIDEGVVITNARHRGLLAQAAGHLDDAVHSLRDDADMDCVTIDLNAAWAALGEITGNTVGEEIIDRIFEKFCLGK